jgi:hypothetical protein
MTAKPRPYSLVYAVEVKRHLRAIDAEFHSLIREAIEERLLFEPGLETRDRKPLRQPAAFARHLGDPLSPRQLPIGCSGKTHATRGPGPSESGPGSRQELAERRR